MKRIFCLLTIALTAFVLLGSEQVAFSQGHVYMYDQGRNKPQRPAPGRFDYNNLQYGTYLGFRMGFNAAWVNSESSYMDANESKLGLNAGIVMGTQIAANAPVFLESGLFYTEKGGKSNYDGKHFTYDLNFLEVPFTFKYAIGIPSNVGLSIQPFMGPYFAFGVGGHVKDFGDRVAYSSFGDSEYKFKRFDAGLKIGCGLGISMFYTELSYNVGLRNIGHDLFDETHSRAFTVTVGMNF